MTIYTDQPKREWYYGFPCKHGNDDGDSMLWAGLLNNVGGGVAFSIMTCQGENGQLWRSPRRVDIDKENSFSRDMAIGFLLAWVDDAALNYAGDRWVDFLIKHKKLCFDSTDTRHIITPTIWWMLSYFSDNINPFWKATRWMLPILTLLQARFAKPGYTLHLQACVGLFLYHVWGKKFTLLGRVLNRRQPANPFFQWLADKPVVVPVEKPYRGNGRQWAWERADSEMAWKDSCGHDYDFIKLLEKL
jgi:hypothetical protein